LTPLFDELLTAGSRLVNQPKFGTDGYDDLVDKHIDDVASEYPALRKLTCPELYISCCLKYILMERAPCIVYFKQRQM